MESRLSESSVKATFDAGHRSLPWQPGQPSGFLAGIDFDGILASPNRKEIVQSLPVQPLYYGLKKRGFADSLEVLPLLTQDQVIRISDFDVWQKGRLSPKKVMDLMGYFGEVSGKELYKRFAFLDEEYQLGTLTGLLEVIEEEEFELLSNELQDHYNPMPCNKVFYRIKSEDPEVISFLDQLIKAACEYNLRYAYSLIAHASYAVPNESEGQIKQFRQARLEEEGFVSYEESLTIFLPIDHQKMKSKWLDETARQGALASTWQDAPFLNIVLDHAREAGWSIDSQYEVHLNLLTLANSICSAVGVEPDDTNGLSRVLEQCQAMVGLSLEYLSSGDAKKGTEVLKAEHPKTLFRVGISLINQLREFVLTRLEQASIPGIAELKESYRTQSWGHICYKLDKDYLEVLGFEMVEILKGLFNRFPMSPRFNKGDLSVQFTTLYSLTVFGELKDYVQGVSALLKGTAIAGGSLAREPFDKVLTTSIMNALLGKGFLYQKLSGQDLESFLALEEGKLTLLIEDFNQSLTTKLAAEKSEWSLPNEQEGLGLDRAMALLNESVTSLRAGHYSGRIGKSMLWIES